MRGARGLASAAIGAAVFLGGCATSRAGEVHMRWADSGAPVTDARVVVRGRAFFLPSFSSLPLGDPKPSMSAVADASGVAIFDAIPLPGVVEVWLSDGEVLSGDIDAGAADGTPKWRELEAARGARVEFAVLISGD